LWPHDVKNVGAQLTMLLGNAALHIGNPEFQQDMLLTIRASAERIRTPHRPPRPGRGSARAGGDRPLPRLRALAQTLGRPGGAAA
jgi:hypothetical protein